jgi:hypothetical protein
MTPEAQRLVRESFAKVAPIAPAAAAMFYDHCSCSTQRCGLNTSLSLSTLTASDRPGVAGEPPLAALPVGDLRRVLAEHQ